MLTLQEVQEIGMQIVAFAGEAKSYYLEALQAAKIGDFTKSQELLKLGDESYHQAHQAHFQLISNEAKGEELPFSLLLIHGEDHLLNSETIKILVEELIELKKGADE